VICELTPPGYDFTHIEQQEKWRSGGAGILYKSSIKLKGRVHCFSMQVIMNKCFLLNPEKQIGANLSCRFREKYKNAKFHSKK